MAKDLPKNVRKLLLVWCVLNIYVIYTYVLKYTGVRLDKTSVHLTLVPTTDRHADVQTGEHNISSSQSFPVTVTNDVRKRDKYGNLLPLTPTDALRLYKENLTEFERKEILNFPQVWFLGLGADKIKAVPGAPMNMGYDRPPKSFYTMVIGDHLAYRYEIIEIYVQGGFGEVAKCLDHSTGQLVAVKVKKNAYRHPPTGTDVEIDMLHYLTEIDENGAVVHILDHFVFRNHRCIVMELMSFDLRRLINKFPDVLSMDEVREYAYSMLQSLSFLRKACVNHRDLKSDNVMVHENNKGSVKLLDFSMSCVLSGCHTKYSQTLPECIDAHFGTIHYKSPEAHFGMPVSYPMDMWSFAIIVADFRTGPIHIFKGQHYTDFMLRMMEVLGMPPKFMLNQTLAPWSAEYFDSKGRPLTLKDHKNRTITPGSKSLAKALNTTDAAFLDFMKKCLTWDPKLRLTPDEALNHKWIRGHLPSHKTNN